MTAALILAAGRGERMRPLTDHTPKPLLAVQGRPLLQWHVQALLRDGFRRLVVNTAWLEEQISSHFGLLSNTGGYCLLQNNEQRDTPWELALSREGHDFGHALETAGGVARALPLLCQGGHDIFWVLAGDVYMPGWKFAAESVARFAASGRLAHLWLVPNPPHNPRGDFGLSADGLALNQVPDGAPRYTYSTVGLYHRKLFAAPWCDIPAGNPDGIKAPLAPLLRAAMDNGQVSAELYHGPWTDVGTPERLDELNRAPT